MQPVPYGLSPSGFRRKPYDQIIADKQERARDLFGEDIELSDRSPLGLYIQATAWEESKLWDDMERVYYAAFIDTAEGVQLDALVKYIGLFRRPRWQSTGTIAITGTPDRHIPVGLIVRTENGVQFVTFEDVTLDSTGTATAWVRAVRAGKTGNVTTGRIDRLFNPQVGISSVRNLTPTNGGLEIETDDELRERYYRSLQRKGKATRAAIEAALLELPTVKDALVLENTSMEIDEYGIPPKAIAPYVFDGDPESIARAIVDTKSAGIQSYGDIVLTVLDSRGRPHQIGYTKATSIPVMVEVTLFRNSRFRPDYETQLRSNILAYIGGIDHDGREFNGLGLGQNIVHSRMVAITADRGIDDAIVKISVDGGDTWVQHNVDISSFQVAVTDFESVVII